MRRRVISAKEVTTYNDDEVLPFFIQLVDEVTECFYMYSAVHPNLFQAFQMHFGTPEEEWLDDFEVP